MNAEKEDEMSENVGVKSVTEALCLAEVTGQLHKTVEQAFVLLTAISGIMQSRGIMSEEEYHRAIAGAREHMKTNWEAMHAEGQKEDTNEKSP
jgi:hypothetical protein